MEPADGHRKQTTMKTSNVYPTRPYLPNEFPSVGDVIHAGYNGSFNTGIITKIGSFDVTFERVHAKVENGALVTEVETITLTVAQLREHCQVFTTGASGKIENRNY